MPLPSEDYIDFSYASLLRKRERYRRMGLDTSEIDIEIERREFQKRNPNLDEERKLSTTENVESLTEHRAKNFGLAERKFGEGVRQFDTRQASTDAERERRSRMDLMRFHELQKGNAQRISASKALEEWRKIKLLQEQGLVPDPRLAARQVIEANRRIDNYRKALLTEAMSLDRAIDRDRIRQSRASEDVATYSDASEQGSPYRAAAVATLNEISATLDERKRRRAEIDDDLREMDQGHAELRGSPMSQPAGGVPATQPTSQPAGVMPAPPPAALLPTSTRPAMAPASPDDSPFTSAPPVARTPPAGPVIPAPSSQPAGGYTPEEIAELQRLRRVSPTADAELRKMGM